MNREFGRRVQMLVDGCSARPFGKRLLRGRLVMRAVFGRHPRAHIGEVHVREPHLRHQQRIDDAIEVADVLDEQRWKGAPHRLQQD